jgi:tellurite methyltransferase
MTRCSPDIPNIKAAYLSALGAAIALFGGVFFCFEAQASSDQKPSRGNVYQRVTGEDQVDEKSRWDSLLNTSSYVYGKDPAAFLREIVTQLPVGRGLDIAMGEGRNAVFLAKKGFKVDGVDFSDVALRKARRLARENNVSINTINADLRKYQIRPNYYDVILNIEFLQRSLVPQIKRGLKRGGLVVFENHTIDQLNNKRGKSLSADFLLKKGELKELFSDFEILIYRETNDGKEALASLLARKP